MQGTRHDADAATGQAPDDADVLVPDPWFTVVRRWVMVAITAAVAVGTLTLGSWESSPGQLDASVSGVETVPAFAGDQHELRWRDPLLHRHADVTDSGLAALRADGVEIVPGSGDPVAGGASMFGIDVPTWVLLLSFPVVFGTFVRIALSARPLLFTRAGWLWISFVPVLGALVFWSVGDGSTRHRDAAREVAPRLSGFAGLGAAVALGTCLSLLLAFL